MHTWDDYCQFLAESHLRFIRPMDRTILQGLHGYQALIELLTDMNEAYAPAVDDIALSFINTGDFSEMDGVELYLLHMRFMCALDTINIMLVGNDIKQMVGEPSGASYEKILEWLLIDTWNGWRFDLWLKFEALRLHGEADSFYGLP